MQNPVCLSAQASFVFIPNMTRTSPDVGPSPKGGERKVPSGLNVRERGRGVEVCSGCRTREVYANIQHIHLQARCGECKYCLRCVHDMANRYVYRSSHPLRCKCGNSIVTGELLRPILSDTPILASFLWREKEHNVNERQFYCPKPGCGQYFQVNKPSSPTCLSSCFAAITGRGPVLSKSYVECPYCKSRICFKCRDLAHSDSRKECGPDNQDQNPSFETRKKRGWRKCGKCYGFIYRPPPNSNAWQISCVCGNIVCFKCDETAQCRHRYSG